MKHRNEKKKILIKDKISKSKKTIQESKKWIFKWSLERSC